MIQQTRRKDLTHGTRLAKNVVWSLMSVGVPLLIALVTIPILIGAIGTERFGLLAISWMFVGYFSLFDFGLGRALTVRVAMFLGEGRETEIPALIWTALSLMLVLGGLGFGVVLLLSPWLVGEVLNVPAALQAESLKAFYLLSLSIPLVIVTVGMQGVIAAYQRFDLLTAVRIPMGMLTFLGPVAVLPFSNSLYPIVGVLVGGRLLATLAHLWLMFRVVPEARRHYGIDRDQIRPLLGFGGWMTVSNMVVPLMVSMDRFVIGAVLTVTAVAYYTTPYEIVSRLLIIPSAFVAVLLPAQSTTLARGGVEDRLHSARLFVKGLDYIGIALFPLVLIMVAFAYDGLNLWVGAEFADHGFRVMQWLGVGVFFYGLSLVPFSLVQSAGYPDWSAKLHLLELPLYLSALWWALHTHGILGAAVVWTLRTFVDALALYFMVWVLIPECRVSVVRLAWAIGGAVGLFLLTAQLDGLLLKFAFCGVVLCGFTWLAWHFVLQQQERDWVLRGLRLGRGV
ncbi:MAG: flippase [Candidatus Thiodiazotropha sp.]|jgi:O-antigen/teichoic acid export membrane protein